MAGEGDLAIWGRLNKQELPILIDPSFWVRHQIDFLRTIFEKPENSETEAASGKEARKYYSLQVSRDQIESVFSPQLGLLVGPIRDAAPSQKLEIVYQFCIPFAAGDHNDGFNESVYALALYNPSPDTPIHDISLRVVECRGYYFQGTLKLQPMPGLGPETPGVLKPKEHAFYRFLAVRHAKGERKPALLLRVEDKKPEGVEIPFAATDIKITASATNANAKQIFHAEILEDKYLKITPNIGTWDREWSNKPGRTVYMSIGDPILEKK